MNVYKGALILFSIFLFLSFLVLYFSHEFFKKRTISLRSINGSLTKIIIKQLFYSHQVITIYNTNICTKYSIYYPDTCRNMYYENVQALLKETYLMGLILIIRFVHKEPFRDSCTKIRNISLFATVCFLVSRNTSSLSVTLSVVTKSQGTYSQGHDYETYVIH